MTRSSTTWPSSRVCGASVNAIRTCNRRMRIRAMGRRGKGGEVTSHAKVDGALRTNEFTECDLVQGATLFQSRGGDLGSGSHCRSAFLSERFLSLDAVAGGPWEWLALQVAPTSDHKQLDLLHRTRVPRGTRVRSQTRRCQRGGIASKHRGFS
jgi:hypothetical protein